MPLPDYMLGVLITPNRVEELTCIQLIWKWHIYVIEGRSITYLFESIPLNQFVGRTLIEKVGGGLGHLYFVTLYLSHFQSLEWHAIWKKRPAFWLRFPNWTGTKQTIKLITIVMKLSLARLICLGWTSTTSNVFIWQSFHYIIDSFKIMCCVEHSKSFKK